MDATRPFGKLVAKACGMVALYKRCAMTCPVVPALACLLLLVPDTGKAVFRADAGVLKLDTVARPLAVDTPLARASHKVAKRRLNQYIVLKRDLPLVAACYLVLEHTVLGEEGCQFAPLANSVNVPTVVISIWSGM